MDQRLIDAIDKHGWQGMSVASRADEPDDGPAFCYSIGFETSLGLPNVIIFGLRTNVMHGMLWQVFDALKAGRTLEDRSVWPEPLEGYKCELRAVHRTNLVSDYFGYGLWYHERYLERTDPYSAFQLFWPGVGEKLLPWEEGCHEDVIAAQPRLDLPHKDLH
ncbi:DUF4262 domain-containing protein [Parvularcula flava]|nr:DUF4262 domain-containing protein [Aquisalinus luteolus]NHK26881.1 DUF4262 domain-containing protein [Aquisalinus luteolus]